MEQITEYFEFFHWDNAKHHLEVPNFPFHKHEKDGTVVSSTEISISEILDELYNIIDK